MLIHTWLKIFPEENETECSEHINQTTYKSTTVGFNYTGLFLPQRNLNFNNTGASIIRIYLNAMGSFDDYSMMMRAFDSGKFFIKIITDLYHDSRFC